MSPLTLAQMAGGDGPSPFLPGLLMLGIIGIFYFIVIRPQQAKEREKDEFRSKLKKGDEVVAVGGLYGRVIDIKGQVVWIELAPNVRVRVERRSIEPIAAKPAKSEEKESSAS
jgi:preprotein translocase subunit YajC